MSSTSSLLKALRSERERIGVPGCKICSWLAVQNAELLSEVDSWIADGLQIKPLHAILSDNGMPGCYATFHTHVRRCVNGTVA